MHFVLVHISFASHLMRVRSVIFLLFLSSFSSSFFSTNWEWNVGSRACSLCLLSMNKRKIGIRRQLNTNSAVRVLWVHTCISAIDLCYNSTNCDRQIFACIHATIETKLISMTLFFVFCSFCSVHYHLNAFKYVMHRYGCFTCTNPSENFFSVMSIFSWNVNIRIFAVKICFFFNSEILNS